MGFAVERYGYLTVPQMMGDMIGDLTANGFTIAYTNKTQITWNAASFQPTDTYEIILEASSTVDPLNSTSLSTTQPWRIMFNVTGPQICVAAVGTPIQLPNTGAWAVQALPANPGSAIADIIGVIGSEALAQKETVSSETRTNRFIDRSGGTVAVPNLTVAASRPMSYRLSVTPRGVVIYVWEEGVQENGALASWIVVQRPVDRDTGQVLITGKCPVFCVYSLFGVIQKFTVREVDILRPTLSVSGNTNTTNSNWVINDQQQVSIAENNMYVTTFPSRLNTQRYAYTQVLDMICTTSADVVAEWTDVPLTVFGESTARTYKAMTANGPYGTNMRVLVLESGGGI